MIYSTTKPGTSFFFFSVIFVFILSVSLQAQTDLLDSKKPDQVCLNNESYNQESIDKILNNDGTIKPNISGSFDAKGYQLDYGNNGQPVFRKTPSLQKTGSAASWSSLGTGSIGTDNSVYALAVGPSGEIYVGGAFANVVDFAANNIAVWNGSTWSALSGGGINGVNGQVNAIAVSGSDVFVGGFFTTLGDGSTATNYIAKWNITTGTWSAVTSGGGINGLNGAVYSLAVNGSDVYVGGNFTTLGNGSTTANRIAKWNLTDGTWSALSGGGVNGVNSIVNAIAVIGSDVYVVGSFTTLGNGLTAANRIAKWNTTTSTWSAVTSGGGINGVDSYVFTMAVFGNDIYIGGQFSKFSDGTTANKIAIWNTSTSTWSAVISGSGNNGVNANVKSLAVIGSDIYLGGFFTSLSDNSTTLNYMAKWNTTTSSWSALSGSGVTGLAGQVNVIAANGNDIYSGGQFLRIGYTSAVANHIARWNTTTGTWSALPGSGINGAGGQVNALALSGSDVYVGGSFTTLGNGSTPGNYIAKWNTTSSTWSALSGGGINGVNGQVNAIAVSGSDVFVGGSFTKLGDGSTIANRIAKWNTTTSTWSAVTSGGGINGVSGQVNAIAVSGSDVFVGGSFTTLGNGSTPAKYIAKWNTTTSTWSAVTSGGGINGLNGAVYALAVNGSDVYVGGSFTTLGNGSTPAKYIAKWNTTTSTWSAVTSGGGINGLNGAVYAIAVNGSNVYVGGSFTTLGNGSTAANRIAKWNITDGTWSALSGGGINGVGGQVNAVTVSGSDVYIGGNFYFLDDNSTSANNIIKWNGSAWEPLNDGSVNGLYGELKVLTVSSDEGRLYVGGNFVTAGEATVAYYVAKFGDSGNPLPVKLASFSAQSGGSSVLLSWQTASEVNNYGFEVQRKNTENRTKNTAWESVGFVKGFGNSNSPHDYSFTDNSLSTPGLYFYRLKQIDNDGKYEYSPVCEFLYRNVSFDLSQNYPNPFNPVTSISYQVEELTPVTIRVYNSLGEIVRTLVNEIKPAGRYYVEFNAVSLSSGVYYYSLKAGENCAIKKMIYLK